MSALPLFSEHEEYVRVLAGVIAPLGTGIWAFTELLGVQQQWVGGVLLLLCSLGFFLAFNQSVHLADERLNHRTQGVPSADEL